MSFKIYHGCKCYSTRGALNPVRIIRGHEALPLSLNRWFRLVEVAQVSHIYWVTYVSMRNVLFYYIELDISFLAVGAQEVKFLLRVKLFDMSAVVGPVG